MLNKVLIFSFFATAAFSHDMTPAYPDLKPSHVSGVSKVEMSLFNARSDVKYYQIEVFDKDWSNIPFSATYRVMKIEHKDRKNFDVYIRNIDIDRAVYVCTTSKIAKSQSTKPFVASRICSRLDGPQA